MNGLRPYPEYRDTGVVWTSSIPAHWETVVLRRALRPREGIKIGPFGSQLKLDSTTASGYKIYGQANVIARDFRKGGKFVDEAKFRELEACEVQPGDLLVTMMGSAGYCARVPEGIEPGIMDSHLLRLRVQSDMLLPDFVVRCINETPYIKDQIAVAGKGSIMQGLNSALVKNLALVAPPLDEQAAIVNFLDHADALIRRYIRAKRREIALLNEQKQAIIQQAVTKGLDPNVPMKDSGVEWLGEIPAHWSVRRFKYVATVNSGQVDPNTALYGEHILIAPNHIESGTGRLIRTETANEQGAISGKYLVKPGQVIYSKIRPYLKKAVVAQTECLCSADMYPISPVETELLAEYMLMLLLSNRATEYLVNSSLRAAIPKINREVIGGLWMWYPPLTEQQYLVEWVQQTFRSLDDVIDSLYRQINLMREYRTCLIADVVTGKLDVRQAALRVPEFVEDEDRAEDLISYEEGELDDIADEVVEGEDQ